MTMVVLLRFQPCHPQNCGKNQRPAGPCPNVRELGEDKEPEQRREHEPREIEGQHYRRVRRRIGARQATLGEGAEQAGAYEQDELPYIRRLPDENGGDQGKRREDHHLPDDDGVWRLGRRERFDDQQLSGQPDDR